MRRNEEPPPRITLNEALLPQVAPPSFSARQTPTETRRSYDDEWVFKRGTLIASLEAPTEAAAEHELDVFIAEELPPTAFDLGPGILSPFWLNLAICNGQSVARCWTDFLGQQKQNVLTAIELAERDGWLFRLPFWPLIDQPNREPLAFFSDTGLHRRLIALWESEEERKAAEQERSDPDRAAEMRRGVSHVMRSVDDLRFQGFATHALMRAMPSACSFVFDRPTKGEIDLILDGPGGERWAIEITNGEPSDKPSSPRMFDLHCEELGIDKRRRRVVYRAATATRDQAKAGVLAVTLPMLLAELVQLWA